MAKKEFGKNVSLLCERSKCGKMCRISSGLGIGEQGEVMMSDNLKILFFDCNTSKSKMYTSLCVSKGVSPIYAMNSGEEVLEGIYKHLPDAVVMDLFMSILDSIGVLYELKQKPPAKQPLIVVLTSVCESNLDSKIKQMLYGKGTDMLIFKPCEFEDLLDSIIAKL